MKNQYVSALNAFDSLFVDLPYTAEDKYYQIINQLSIAVVDYRIKNSYTQAQLAEKLSVSQAMISKYESGDYNISLKALVLLLDKLGIHFEIDFQQKTEERSTEIQEPQYMHYSKKTTQPDLVEEYSGIA